MTRGDRAAGGRRVSTAAVSLACCTAVAVTPVRLVRPRRAWRHPVTVAPAPAARAEVRLRALIQARMHAPSAVVAEGVRRPWRTRMAMTTYVVEHPSARFVVDPALCADVFDRVVPGLPAPFRFFVTPERPVVGLGEALTRAGIRPETVDFALPTHLHWDHVSGLLDLPELALRLSQRERDHLLTGDRVPVGFVRPPVAGRPWQPYELDGPALLSFARSHDLFRRRRGGAGGPARSHARLGRRAARRRGRKAPFPGRLVDHDREDSFATVLRLAAVPAGIDVVAAHDADAAERWA